ncbi:DUF3307 domain-containing protein [Streptomyces chryseus]|uniref:DUF3307 domain-containing protein n=1 Tax=Streptomyces chryseus TaxID=68186 RepID=UPI00110F9940|nr:DUF3307 domain-containing protein [Streptomyces chryseus]
MFSALFILLLLGHWAADYPGQTDAMAARKAGWTEVDTHGKAVHHHHGWGANLAHASVHVALCGGLLGLGALLLPEITLSLVPTLLALLWIGATHAVIDRRWPVAAWMRLARQESWAAHGGAAHVDQTLHTLAIGAAALFLASV